jgi:translation initiation factor 1 (eIF-1/SUI1)
MATPEVLKTIVRNGSNLTIARGIPFVELNEIAALAKRSGASVTVSTAMPPANIQKLSEQYGKSITFIEGLDKFEKE